jgi:serine/threonine-protein phosphatase 2B catalytic subunit
VLILEDGNVSIKQFDDSEHPYHLPDRIDIFSWSMPFLIEKVVSMMKSVYTKWQDEEELDEEGFKKATATPTESKSMKLKGKVKAFARVQKMYKTLT